MSTIKLKGSSSGEAEVTVAAAAGTPTFTLPTTVGSANQVIANGSTPGTLEFVHGNNTPLFWVLQGSNQSIANTTNVTITLDTETYDTDSAFASNKFTVPSGKGGLYLFHWNVRLNSVSDGATFVSSLFKNGSEVNSTRHRSNPGAAVDLFIGGGATLPLAAGDYIHLNVYTSGGATTTESSYTYMSGHRLLGV